MTEMELFPLFEGLELPFSQETWDSCDGPLSSETMEKYGLEEWDNGYDLGNDPDGPLGLLESLDGRKWMLLGGRTPDGQVIRLFEYDEEYYLQRD